MNQAEKFMEPGTMKKIKDTSKTLPKIKDTSKTLPKIDGDKVAKALGARRIAKGTKVRMTQDLKDGLMKNGCHEHVEEFGECIGIVQGPVNYGTQKGPEFDVYWQPSNLHYAYHPKYLEIVDDE